MNYIKLDLYNLTLNETFQHAKLVQNSMTGNPNFPSPPITMAEYGTLRETAEQSAAEYEAMLQSLDALKTKRDRDVAALDRGTTRLANYAESEVGNDPAKLLSGGFKPRAPRSPSGRPEAPQSFLAEPGDRPGVIDASWARVRGAKVYEVQVSPEDGSSWKTVMMVTKASATLKDLVSGARLTYRVRAIGTGGEGPWSDPAFKMVP